MKITIVLLAFLLLLGLDTIYLTLTKKFMMDQIVSVQKFTPNLRVGPAIACYVAIFLGLYYFILKTRRPPLDAFILGFVVYAVFELTNYSIFKNWRSSMVLLDTAWGATLFWLTTMLTYQIDRMWR